jgi:hypothetical protein
MLKKKELSNQINSHPKSNHCYLFFFVKPQDKEFRLQFLSRYFFKKEQKPLMYSSEIGTPPGILYDSPYSQPTLTLISFNAYSVSY